jgi:phosphoglycolate phosphatase
MKAYIFDLDGTVVDTLEDITCAINLMLVEYGFPIFTVEEIRKKIGNGARKLVERSLPDNVRGDSEFIDRALKTYQDFYSAHCTDKVSVYTGLDKVLRKMHGDGKKLAIITNKDHIHATVIIDKLLPDVFDVVLGYNGDFPHKPNPESVFSVLEKLSVAPEDTAFIGDSWVDVETGRNAGLLSVGVDWGFLGLDSFDENHKPDIILTSAEDLYSI